MTKKGEIQKGVSDNIATTIKEDASLLMHCYNFQLLFPETMKKLEKEIIDNLVEEGASIAYIKKIQIRASNMSYWGPYQLVDMYSRLKAMAEIMGRDMKNFRVASYTLYKRWTVSAV